MPVVQIGVVRVPVHHRHMPVPMGVRLTPLDLRAMLMAMVLVMPVPMLVLHRLVGVLVVVPLGAKVLVSLRASRRQAAFADQLDDSLQLMASSMRAGHSLLRALDAVAQDADSPTSDEFARIVNETRVGRDLTAALEETAERMGSEEPATSERGCCALRGINRPDVLATGSAQQYRNSGGEHAAPPHPRH